MSVLDISRDSWAHLFPVKKKNKQLAWIDSYIGFQLFCSYLLDVNVDKAEGVLLHQKILAEARDPEKRPAFRVRFLKVLGM